MKRNFILILLCIVTSLSSSFYAEAQEIMRSTVGVSGGSKTVTVGDQQYLVQQSIGQASVIGTFNTSNLVAFQGFIQPPLSVNRVVTEESTLQAGIFPNPFKSILNIAFEDEVKSAIDITIYDVMGRIVYDNTQQAQQRIAIDLEFLATAQYVILIQADNKVFKANILKN